MNDQPRLFTLTSLASSVSFRFVFGSALHQYVHPSEVVILKSFLFASTEGGLLSYSSVTPILR